MAKSIKTLARENECSSLDAFGLAEIWAYWLECNCNDRQGVNDFLSLSKSARREMLAFLRSDSCYSALLDHIIANIY